MSVTITNRKSHTGFRLVPTAMTLNAVIAFILRFFHRIRQIFRPIISVVEDRPIRKILSPSSSVLLLAKTITHPAAEHLVINSMRVKSSFSIDVPVYIFTEKFHLKFLSYISLCCGESMLYTLFYSCTCNCTLSCNTVKTSAHPVFIYNRNV